MRFISKLVVIFSLALMSCAESETSGEDVIQPMGIDSYITDAPGNEACAGIDPPEGITEFHHQQCANWAQEGLIEGCEATVNPNPEEEDLCDSFFKESTTSDCCCMLCGLKAGEPACFNLLCPGIN
jgi:hypothetical protein